MVKSSEQLLSVTLCMRSISVISFHRTDYSSFLLPEENFACTFACNRTCIFFNYRNV